MGKQRSLGALGLKLEEADGPGGRDHTETDLRESGVDLEGCSTRVRSRRGASRTGLKMRDRV